MRQITLVAALAAFCGAISAQVDKSNLTGIVRYGTGAAIPAVSIKLTSLGTGAVHSETSDACRFYRFTLIDRGVSRLAAQPTGFKRFRRDSADRPTGETTTLDTALTLSGVPER